MHQALHPRRHSAVGHNSTDTVRRTPVNVGQCLLEDDSTR